MSAPSLGDPTEPVHIVVVGAGAVGCFYASRLHSPQHNVHVSLIGRSNYAALARDGVQMQTRDFGDYVFRPHAVYPSVAAAAEHDTTQGTKTTRAWDFVIVTTKALPDRGDDAALVAPLVTEGTALVLIQNGVGVEAPFRARFPTTPIVSGVTVISAEQVRPGVVRQNRWTRVHLGPYTNSAETAGARASTLAGDEVDRLARTGADATHRMADWLTRYGGLRDAEALDEAALQTVRWHKLCINAAFNPSAVLAGGRGNADMAADAELREHLAGVMAEIWAAAPRVLGAPFPPSMASPERILQSTARNTGARPSMLLDWEAGRALELEVILGNPVRIARAKGVALPRMQTLYALLRSAQAVRDKAKL